MAEGCTKGFRRRIRQRLGGPGGGEGGAFSIAAVACTYMLCIDMWELAGYVWCRCRCRITTDHRNDQRMPKVRGGSGDLMIPRA